MITRVIDPSRWASMLALHREKSPIQGQQGKGMEEWECQELGSDTEDGKVGFKMEQT